MGRCMCVLLALSVAACDESSEPAAPSAPSPRTTASALAAPTPPVPRATSTSPVDAPSDDPDTATDSGSGGEEGDAAACTPKDASLKPLQLLGFVFASRVESRKPVEQLRFARPGQRVYAYLRMRNRSGEERCLRVEFRVNGKKRTSVELEVGESWQWRTWAYATLRASDTSGTLELRVIDDQDRVVVDKRLPIVAKVR